MSDDLNRVDKRAVEAMAVIPVIEAAAARFGREEALALLREVNEAEALQRGRELAQKMGQSDIQALVAEVETWGLGWALEMDVLEQTDSTYFFNVTRCPYAEKYEKLGLMEYGVFLSCCRDEPFARGFNPDLRLVRSQTIMEGAPHCDFRYHLGASK